MNIPYNTNNLQYHRFKTAKTALAGALILALAAEPVPAFALRARGGGSPIVAAGLERIFTAGAEEGTPIAAVEAARIVRGWDGLQAAQRQAVLESLADHGYTLEKHRRHAELILKGEQENPASFKAFPPHVDGKPGSADYERLLRAGRDRKALGREGILIAAAGEGTRLLENAVKAGLLPPDTLERYTKPTAPVTPVRGQSPLGYQLETYADEAATRGIPLPVRVVLHPEVGTKVARMIQENSNFGLAHLELVFQGMNPALDSDGRVLLRDDGAVSFNPDGTGGVIRAALQNGGGEWFEAILGPEAHLAIINGDMLLEPELVELVAGAAAEHPVVGIGYGYPPEKEAGGAHRFKLGTFVTLEQSGRTRTKIVEYRERGAVEGMPEAVAAAEQRGAILQANSGLYGFHLKGLADRVRDLPPHHQKDKEAADVRGKVQKIEEFVTDIPANYDAAQVVVLSVDQAILTPIKDAGALKQVRALAVERERRRAQQMGIALSPEARVEFHPAMNRPGRVAIGRNVRVEGGVGVYVHPGGVALYIRAQPDKPWEPFDPSAKMELFQTQPGWPVVIPDGTLFSPEGVTGSVGAEDPETVVARLVRDWGLQPLPELRVAVVEHPILPEMAGKSVRMGDGWLIALPERATAEQISEMLMPVAADLSGKGLSVWEYFSGEKDEPLRMFDRAARGIGGRVTIHDQPVEGLPLGLMAQIIAALRGIEPSAVREEDVRLFEEALLFA